MGEPLAKCGCPSKRWRGLICTRNATVYAADGRFVCRTHRDIIERDIARKPRPTIRTFHGETGEDSVHPRGASPHAAWPRGPLCPAPTPEEP